MVVVVFVFVVAVIVTSRQAGHDDSGACCCCFCFCCRHSLVSAIRECVFKVHNESLSFLCQVSNLKKRTTLE